MGGGILVTIYTYRDIEIFYYFVLTNTYLEEKIQSKYTGSLLNVNVIFPENCSLIHKLEILFDTINEVCNGPEGDPLWTENI